MPEPRPSTVLGCCLGNGKPCEHLTQRRASERQFLGRKRHVRRLRHLGGEPDSEQRSWLVLRTHQCLRPHTAERPPAGSLLAGL